MTRTRVWALTTSLAIAAVATAVVAFRHDPPSGSTETTGPFLPTGSLKAPPTRTRAGGLNVTFIAASDTHLGFESGEFNSDGQRHDPLANPRGVELVNARAITAMNTLPGTSWPEPLDGPIGLPRGVIISGDLTENGRPYEWSHFLAMYAGDRETGGTVLRYPVFEGYGNHDKHHSWYVLDRIRERHGGYRYSFDWDDLHLVNLGEAPDDAGLDFLQSDLNKVGPDRPVVVYQHFPMLGPFSDNWFGKGNYRERLARVLKPFNIVAIFHGHYHASGRYKWQGFDVYNVGASKHNRHSFSFVRVTDDTLRVASYHYDHKTFQWWHEKPINGSTKAERSGGSRKDQGLLLSR